ncbi:phosphodiester glycosidase family protein [Psychroserpens sp. NJDZ02]|uniref:phosphodiester glycosidase family protein n=1 Tax=Psychroserpens sp. NJDZ02 TaxID=2570561 RepID=UPI0010A8B6B0|nr:phosphodiester glycosidase family protein [Psychroserpens sp. NJDZ02]QCE41775.1 phosphodiester glycosidase family protein [Psychroserpens sp. NJDZ02]
MNKFEGKVSLLRSNKRHVIKSFLYLVLATTIIVLLSSFKFSEGDITWEKIDEGLYYAAYDAPIKSKFGDSKINILKIAPSLYNLNLLTAQENDGKTRTAKDWLDQKKQIAVINAGMYMTDHSTNVGYMKNFDVINNGRVSRDNTIAAFNRKNDSVPEFQIIDLKCQNWEQLKTQYNSFTQSIRMMDCNQKNKWSQQNKMWSMVVIGKDKKGNVLFIFVRSPYSVHNFINILSNSSLDLYNLMYLEGGPEASFYLNHNGTKVERMGSYETGFNENDKNNDFWDIPNVIGISKK